MTPERFGHPADDLPPKLATLFETIRAHAANQPAVCHQCAGRGFTDRHTCGTCRGIGSIREPKS